MAPRVIAEARANAQGEAVATVTTPADMPWRQVVTFQAVAILPRSALPSPTVSLLSHGADGDRDGLFSPDEADAGTDVHNPDSDGGGTIDGQEVLVDGTDPNDPSDDVHVEADCDDRVDGDGDGTADEGDADCPHRPGEVCGNGVDDNGDHYTDCRDLECIGHPTCAELCNDRHDNDLDNVVDCFDSDCATSPLCERRCNGNFDEDHDLLIDCLDPDCAGSINCPLQGEICDDRVDNNRNNLVDCADPACRTNGLCSEQCWDGVDNTRDGLVDCADPGCVGSLTCREQCFDGLDNDGNGLVDLQDPASCAGMYLEVCGDGADNDADGAADCRDQDCWDVCPEDCADGIDNNRDNQVDCNDEQCAPQCQERCYDRADNDGDHLLDCADPDCTGRCPERCHNGGDEDLDGRIDCADSDCTCAEVCNNGVDDDRNGATDCADAACGTACGEVCDNGTDDDADGLVDCEDGSCTDQCVESCGNGVDDDGDLWTDCQDEECWEDTACPPVDHVAWVFDGSVFAGGRIWSMTDACGLVVVDSGFGTATNVRGLVHVDHAGRGDLCAWSANRVEFNHGIVQTFDPVTCAPVTETTADVHRYSFAVEPGCGLDDSGFLPHELRGRGVWSDPNRSAVLPAGTAWYAAGAGTRVAQWMDPSLAAVGVYGECATGQPTRVRAPHLVGGALGVCAP